MHADGNADPDYGPTSPPAGWYPDPSGAPAQRYWDGNSWSGHVTPTGPSYAPQYPPSAPRSRAPWLIGIAVLVALLALLTLWAMRPSRQGQPGQPGQRGEVRSMVAPSDSRSVSGSTGVDVLYLS